DFGHAPLLSPPAHVAKKDVARAVDRLDQARVLGILSEFGPEPRDAHIHGPVEAFARRAAKDFLHLRARDEPLGAFEEEPENLALRMAEGYFLTGLAGQQVAVEMSRPAREVRDRRDAVGVGAALPQAGADAGDDLGWVERLYDVVVGAQFQP